MTNNKRNLHYHLSPELHLKVKMRINVMVYTWNFQIAHTKSRVDRVDVFINPSDALLQLLYLPLAPFALFGGSKVAEGQQHQDYNQCQAGQHYLLFYCLFFKLNLALLLIHVCLMSHLFNLRGFRQVCFCHFESTDPLKGCVVASFYFNLSVPSLLWRNKINAKWDHLNKQALQRFL